MAWSLPRRRALFPVYMIYRQRLLPLPRSPCCLRPGNATGPHPARRGRACSVVRGVLLKLTHVSYRALTVSKTWIVRWTEGGCVFVPTLAGSAEPPPPPLALDSSLLQSPPPAIPRQYEANSSMLLQHSCSNMRGCGSSQQFASTPSKQPSARFGTLSLGMHGSAARRPAEIIRLTYGATRGRVSGVETNATKRFGWR
jgi:hypothetical protein